ncbi:MAG: 3-isopropylmalate dehydratase large subunit [Nitrospinae bacterium]|nr:3-isopropylmalate dehydratase large subunit [Nitrospinota bacterium]
MKMTITERILADHAGLESVKPGQLVNCKVDIALANDITAPISIKEFRRIGAKKVFDKERVVFVADHFAPNKDIESAMQVKMVRDFSAEFGITNFYDAGTMGVEHTLLPEKGLVGPGDLVIGADSHTCTYGALGAFASGVGSTDLAAAMITGEAWYRVPETMLFNLKGKPRKWVGGKDVILYIIGKIGVDGALYKAMEYTGDMIGHLTQDDRFTICNMAIEAGAKNGIFTADAVTKEYVNGRFKREAKYYASDPGANYSEKFDINADDIELMVAFPHLPSNTRGISKVGEVKIDQVVIGSCTNGRYSDLKVTAEILRGKKVAKGVRLIVIPATPLIYKQAMNAGLFDVFMDANAVVSTPTCGPCLGGHMGILAEGEKALSTTNRNFVGRMGHRKSEIYLAGPAVAAATAIAGKICSPEDVL